jgi:archaellum component FlaC
MQEQIIGYKKRINDLSILKSTNNATMNQKIAKVVEENQKLKSEIEEVKTGVKATKGQEKPVLFGANEFD